MTLIIKEDNTTIGERIKRLRKEKRMTQEELGKRIGVLKTAIMKYEKGLIVSIPQERLEAIAYELGVTYEYLTTGYDRLGDVPMWYDEETGEWSSELEDGDRARLRILLEAASDERVSVILKMLELPPEKFNAIATLAGIKD